jgi:putrescine aminotransferase
MSADEGVIGAPPAAEVFTAARNHLNRRSATMEKFLGRNAYAVAARGPHVFLNDGRRLLDLATWATSVLGHCPPQVVNAVVERCASLPSAARGLANDASPRLAERLVRLAEPSRLQRVWFGANGADVVEAALKLARLRTGRLRVLAVRDGFHGRTLGAMAVSDADRSRNALEPLLPGVGFMDVVPEAVEREARAGDVAGVIFEVIQGGGAVSTLDLDVLRRWVADAHAAGAMVIVDEIQTGLWRGGAFSLALKLGLDPDAVLFGKTLAGGILPLSALLCSSELFAPLEANPALHSQTFSGHPLSCAAGIATLDLLPGLAAANLDRVGGWLASLQARLRSYPDLIADVRVYGLMLSLEFRSPEVAQQYVVAAAHKGILLRPLEGNRSMVRILAPLVLEEPEMSEAADVLSLLAAEPQSWPTRFEAAVAR